MPEEVWEKQNNEELIAEYLKTKDLRLKQFIVLRYRGMVKTVAMQMRGVYVSFAELDDIIDEGIIALMNALDRFDLSKNVKFESYASLRIRGTIIDLARKQDWVSRTVRKFAKQVDAAEHELYSLLGRSPTEQEIAKHLSIDIEKYHKLIGQTGMYNVLSLDTLIEEAHTDLATGIHGGLEEGSPAQQLQKKELRETLQSGISNLKENEQLVVSLYYRKELNMKEIAKVLGVSEPRVSQIHANALRKLRAFMEEY